MFSFFPRAERQKSECDFTLGAVNIAASSLSPSISLRMRKNRAERHIENSSLLDSCRLWELWVWSKPSEKHRAAHALWKTAVLKKLQGDDDRIHRDDEEINQKPWPWGRGCSWKWSKSLPKFQKFEVQHVLTWPSWAFGKLNKNVFQKKTHIDSPSDFFSTEKWSHCGDLSKPSNSDRPAAVSWVSALELRWFLDQRPGARAHPSTWANWAQLHHLFNLEREKTEEDSMFFFGILVLDDKWLFFLQLF